MTTPDPVLMPLLPWLDALPNPGLVVDFVDGVRVQYANLAAAEHFGQSLQGLPGPALRSLWPELDARLAAPEPLPRTFRVPGAGPWAWVDVLAFRVGELVAVQLSDATAQHAADVRSGALFDLTAALSRTLTAEQAAEIMLRQGLSALGAAAGSVYVLDEEASELVHAGAIGYDETYLQGWQRFPLSAPTLLGDALRGRAPLILSAAEMAERYPHLRVQRTVSTDAVAALPLLFGGRAVGVMHFGFARPVPPGPGERTFMLTLAEELAQALERARLFAGERRAGERAALLYSLTAALAATRSPEDVVQTIARTSTPALGAAAGLVFQHDAAREELVLMEVSGAAAGRAAGWNRFSVHQNVIGAECARSGQALFLGTPQYLEQYPHMRGRSPTQACAALPLVSRGQTIGVLVYGWDEPHTFVAAERDLLLALAGQCAQALERTLLTQAQDRTRRVLARQAALLDQTHDAVFTWELGGTITFWNAGAERLYGFSRDEALGRVSHELLDTDHGELDIPGLEAALREHGEWQRIIRHSTKDGRAVTVDSRHVLVPGEDGAPDLVLETNRDVTVQERARAQATLLARAGELLSASPDPQAVLDRLATLIVPDLADGCNVLLPDGQGHLVPHTVAHVDPEWVRLVREYHERVPMGIDLDGPHPAARVMQSGEALLMSNLVDPASLWDEEPGDPELVAALEAAGVRSLMVVPLVARGELLGIVSFLSGTPGRFGADDLAFARDLARRAALALDNTQLLAEREAALARVRHEQERLLAVLDQLPVAVWLAELPSGRLIGGNAAIETLMRQGFLAARAVEEYSVYEGYHPDGRRVEAHEWPLARTLATGEAVVDEEYDVVRPDGTRGTMGLSSTVIRDAGGTPILAVAVGQDATERKRAELTLRDWGSELERQVAAQTRELRATNEGLEAFAYSVSHDLRAPVRHVGSFATLLRNRLGDNPGALRYVEQIEGAARRMDGLIDALLGLARTGMAELHLSEVDLNLLVQAVRSDLALEWSGRQVTWRVGELPTVRADVSLLRQVLANLLGNAVKYSGGREQAVIEVWAEETPGAVTVAVRDNGAGFDSQYAGRLFGVFQRLHTQREFEGTGVGLANVKRIVEKHGGRVWAEGRPGEGATFFFSLPRP